MASCASHKSGRRDYVLKFGVDPIAPGLSSLGEVDVLNGTPSYMSPEQRGGRIADQRSDQHSLGVIFIEMPAERKPHAAKLVAMMVKAHLRAPSRGCRTRLADIRRSSTACWSRTSANGSRPPTDCSRFRNG